jgi:hypothetical protein
LYVIGGGNSVQGGPANGVYLDITENYPTATIGSTFNNAWVVSAYNYYSGTGSRNIVITGYAICAQ